MPMNSNIPFQALATVPLQSPLNSMLRVQGLRRSQQEEQLNAMRMDKYRQDMADAPRLAAQQNAQEFLKEAVPMLAKLPPEQRPGAFAQVLAYGQQSGESMDGIPQSYDQISRLVDAAAVPDPMTPYQSARLNQYDQGLEIQRYNATKPPQFQPQAPVMVVDPVTGKPTYAAPGDSYGRQAYVKPSTAKTPEYIRTVEEEKARGKASVKAEENAAVMLPKLRMMVSANNESKTAVLSTIDELIGKPAKDGVPAVRPKIDETTAGFGGLLQWMPRSDARKVAGDIEMIKSNIGLDKLAEMRAMAANGASGLGQLAIRELDALMSQIATLDQLQDPKDLIPNIQKVRDRYESATKRFNEFAEDEAKRMSSTPGNRAPSGGGADGAAGLSDEDLKKELGL